ncbi:hypothetical protein D3C76_1274100 [compost metagenome]
MGFRVGEHGGTVSLAACACRGRHQDIWQCVLCLGFAKHIIPDAAWIAGTKRDAFGHIHCAATTNTNHQIALLLACHFSTGFHQCGKRVLHKFVIDGKCHPGGSQGFLCPSE